MNVITLASRKGGAGKSTLTAQLAAQAHALGKRTLIIDADPQGSLSLWHSLRKDGLPKLVTPERGLERAIAFARSEEHTSELQSPCNLVCRLLLEKKNKNNYQTVVCVTL